MDWLPQKRDAEGGGGNSDSQKGKEGETVKQGRNRKNGQRLSVCLLTTGKWESELSQKSRKITFLKKEMECQEHYQKPTGPNRRMSVWWEVGASGPDTGSERGPALAASQERQERTQPLSSMSRTFSRPLPFCFADFLYCFPVFNFIDSCS